MYPLSNFICEGYMYLKECIQYKNNKTRSVPPYTGKCLIKVRGTCKCTKPFQYMKIRDVILIVKCTLQLCFNRLTQLFCCFSDHMIMYMYHTSVLHNLSIFCIMSWPRFLPSQQLLTSISCLCLQIATASRKAWQLSV